MRRKYSRKKCCLTSVSRRTARQRKRSTWGNFLLIYILNLHLKNIYFLCIYIWIRIIRYIVHKILMCSLGRLEEDDRDHLGKKRLDLAGPLIGSLFRMLFKQLTKDVRKTIQKSLDEGKQPNMSLVFLLIYMWNFHIKKSFSSYLHILKGNQSWYHH